MIRLNSALLFNWRAGAIGAAALLVVAAAMGCKREPPKPRDDVLAREIRHNETQSAEEHAVESHRAEPPSAASPKRRADEVASSRKTVASWYDVPEHSLAHRRAGSDELTAAHDHLPLGTRVRVTDLDNGRSVVVRVTDRGLHTHRATIDLCKEAAEQLGMVSKGIARVRVEVLKEPDGLAVEAAPSASAAH